jgi:hypothetical protein
MLYWVPIKLIGPKQTEDASYDLGEPTAVEMVMLHKLEQISL